MRGEREEGERGERGGRGREGEGEREGCMSKKEVEGGKEGSGGKHLICIIIYTFIHCHVFIN